MEKWFVDSNLKIGNNMLLSFSELVKKYELKITGIIQVGSHFCEEHDEYIENKIPKIAYIEPCAKAFDVMLKKFGGKWSLNRWIGVGDNKNTFGCEIELLKYACSDFTGTAVMYTGDNTVNKGQSNSLLKPAKHLQIHPEVEFPDTEIVDVIRLDELNLQGYNFLNMDCQGTEGDVLRGATETLKGIDYVYTEANKDEVYEGCTRIEELDELLHEFERVETGFWCGGMWTDVFYVRTNKS